MIGSTLLIRKSSRCMWGEGEGERGRRREEERVGEGEGERKREGGERSVGGRQLATRTYVAHVSGVFV